MARASSEKCLTLGSQLLTSLKLQLTSPLASPTSASASASASTSSNPLTLLARGVQQLGANLERRRSAATAAAAAAAAEGHSLAASPKKEASASVNAHGATCLTRIVHL